MNLQTLIDKLDNAHINPPLETQEFWSLEFNIAQQNLFRTTYLQEYTEALYKAVKRYCVSGQAAAFLAPRNLEILTRKVQADLSLELFEQLPTEAAVKEVLLWMLEGK